MRTLHVGLRVSNLERSLAFYTAVGYTVIGTVEKTAYGSLTMLQLPGDDFVTIELVHDPAKTEARSRRRHQPPGYPGRVAGHNPRRSRRQRDRTRADRLSRRPHRAADLLDHRPGRLPDRGTPVAQRPCRRHHQGRLHLNRRTYPAPTHKPRPGGLHRHRCQACGAQPLRQRGKIGCVIHNGEQRVGQSAAIHSSASAHVLIHATSARPAAGVRQQGLGQRSRSRQHLNATPAAPRQRP